MSEIRKQLEAAREEHRRARYPGDLANDVLPSQGRGRLSIVLWVGGMTGAAIAAGIALVVILHRPTPPQPGETVPALASSSVLDMPAKPDMPPVQLITDLGERPEMPSFFAIKTAVDQEEHL